jgi:hypothetical protein
MKSFFMKILLTQLLLLFAACMTGTLALFADQLTITMVAPHIHAFEKLPIVFSVNDSQTGNAIKDLKPVIQMQKSGEDKRYEITLASGELVDKGDGTYEWTRQFSGTGFYSVLFVVRTMDKDYSYRTFPLEVSKAGGEKIFKPSMDEAKYNYQVRWSANPYSPKPGDEVYFDIELKRTIGAIDLDKPWTSKFEHLVPSELKSGAPSVVIETGEGAMVKDITSTADYLGLGVYRVSMKFPKTGDSSTSMGKMSDDAKAKDASTYRLNITFTDDAGYTVNETGDNYDFEVRTPTYNDTTVVKTAATENVVNNYKVKLVFKDKTAKTGMNEFTIKLTDTANMPVENANMTLVTKMDQNSQMSMNMNNVDPISLQLTENVNVKGEYLGKIDLKYAGSWIAKANFTVNGKENSTDFNVEVSSAGPNWVVIGIFTGLLLLIVLFAGIRKMAGAKQSNTTGANA